MINYIILGHKNPRQIKRLIAALETSDAFFYIHIDRNVDLGEIKQELSCFRQLVFLENEQRFPGIWGDLGIVKATISALKRILSDNRKGYCVLLSGQDFPLVSKYEIESFFQQNYGTNFITVFPLPASFWLNSDERINYYKINKSANRGDYVLLPSIYQRSFYTVRTRHCIKQLLALKKFSFLKLIFKRRSFPKVLKPYGGDQWWALPIETVEKILAFIDEHPGYINYHNHSLLPDEMFFQSIFMYFNKEKNILPYQPSVTYVNWARENVSLPVTFTAEDIEELASLPETKLFARKFDLDIDEKIFDYIKFRSPEKAA